MKARQLIQDILEDIGRLGVGDYLSDEDAEKGLGCLNDWLDSLSLERLTMYYLLRTQQTLSSGVSSYTIGLGGTFNIDRPTEIDDAAIVLDIAAATPTEKPIDVFTDQQWTSIRQKTLQSPLASGVFYDHNLVSGLARVYPWPIPNVGTTALVLYTKKPLSAFANLDTDYEYPRGYRLFLRTNAALILAPAFGKSLSAEAIENAKVSRRNIKRANDRPVESMLDPRVPGTYASDGGVYDWRTDSFR